jgi:hypothetical protein
MSDVTVKAIRIIGTNTVVYSAWLPLMPSVKGFGYSHSTQCTINGKQMGRVGTEELPPELAALPPRTQERLDAVTSFFVSRYDLAYKAIAEYRNGNYSGTREMGEISTLV